MSEEITAPVGEPEVVAQEAEPEVVLPSDIEEFVMPEKFADKSAEDIAKAYVELEKLKTEKASEDVPPVETPEGEAPPVTRELLDEYVEKARLNEGELTEEHYAELAAKGYSKDVVDVYAKGVQAEQAAEAKQILETAGTNEADFLKAGEWARDNLPEAEITRINNVLSKAQGDELVTAIDSLMMKYNGREVAPADNIHVGGQGTPPSRGYNTESDMHKDMLDPRYTTDRSFHEAVKKKVAATTAF